MSYQKGFVASFYVSNISLSLSRWQMQQTEFQQVLEQSLDYHTFYTVCFIVKQLFHAPSEVLFLYEGEYLFSPIFFLTWTIQTIMLESYIDIYHS